MICKECGERLSQREFLNHFHAVRMVSTDTGVYLISLPDGCAPGRWEAARAFAEVLVELHAKVPGKTFTFTPFDHEGGRVSAWVAVAN